MSIFIKQSYDDGFQHLLLDLKDKYPKSIFQLEGIDESQLDITQFSQNYFIKGKTVADTTIDSNANVSTKDVSTYKAEMHKAEDKLNSLYLLWKTTKKNWGTKYANKLIEEEITKDINIQDCTHLYLPYCWAFDCIDLVDTGLPFITNKPSKPAKHADTLLRHTEQMIMAASKQMMGATAIPNVLVIYSALLKNDLNDKKYHLSMYKDSPYFKQYLKQEFQKFVFTINQPIRDAQSPFTNITIFDSIFLKELCNLYLINGEHIDPEFAMKIQKEFIECFLDFNREELFTFPVLTAQFKIDEDNCIEDKVFFDYICERNLNYATFNIFSTKSLTSLSSCCFEGNEVIKIKNTFDNKWFYITIQDFVEMYNVKNKENYESLIENEFIINSYNKETKSFEECYIDGVLKTTKYNELIKIELENNKIITVTKDHKFIVFDIIEQKEIEILAENLIKNKERYLLPVE